MNLNHINLCSSDVTALAEKLATYFGYRILDSRSFPKSDGSGMSTFALVVGDDGAELVITQIDPTPDGQSAYPQGFASASFKTPEKASSPSMKNSALPG